MTELQLELKLQTMDENSPPYRNPPGSSASKSSTKLNEQRLITEQQLAAEPQSPEWINTFNTSLLTTRAEKLNNQASELVDLMNTPEFSSILVGANHLAQTQGIGKEEATERLITIFRKIDREWKQIVVKRGLQSLISK